MTDTKSKSVAIKWWTAANNNEEGMEIISTEIDNAHIALALDAAEYMRTESQGSCGINTHEVVLLDEDGEIITTLTGPDEEPDNEFDLSDLPDGELELDEVLEYEGTVWDGQNHVVLVAARARRYVADTRREQIDGRVTWVFDDDGDGGENLIDVVIDDDWEEVDFYADGYGNQSSKFNLALWKHVVETSGLRVQVSEITDNASNEPAEAGMLVAHQDDAARVREYLALCEEEDDD